MPGTVSTTRSSQLLRHAADVVEQGGVIGIDFYIQHDVRDREVTELTAGLACGARLVAAMQEADVPPQPIEDLLRAIVARGV